MITWYDDDSQNNESYENYDNVLTMLILFSAPELLNIDSYLISRLYFNLKHENIFNFFIKPFFNQFSKAEHTAHFPIKFIY